METIYINSTDEFIETAVLNIATAAERAIRNSGSFNIVLSGGETPGPVYRYLAKQNFDWSLWHVWFADERKPDPDESVLNWKMVDETFLNAVSIPAAQVHRINTEEGVNKAAEQYNLELQKVNEFDLVVLGLGEDGHTASLFSGMDHNNDKKKIAAFPVLQSPKPPLHRVTMSISRLCNAKEILFLVSGIAKRKIVRALEEKKEIPASYIKGHISTKLLYFQSQ